MSCMAQLQQLQGVLPCFDSHCTLGQNETLIFNFKKCKTYNFVEKIQRVDFLKNILFYEEVYLQNQHFNFRDYNNAVPRDTYRIYRRFVKRSAGALFFGELCPNHLHMYVLNFQVLPPCSIIFGSPRCTQSYLGHTCNAVEILEAVLLLIHTFKYVRSF